MTLRRAGTLAVGVLVVGGPLALAVALGRAVPVEQLDQHAGGVWVASPEQGMVTLVDGASERVVVSVPVPGAVPGDGIGVVQAGSSAYLTHTASGAVLRLDGATFEVGRPQVLTEPGTAPQVLARGSDVVAVDPVRHTATPLDVRSLAPGRPVSLSARAGPGQALIDDTGRLWVVDGDGGSLTWVDGQSKRIADGQSDPRSQLVLVRGRPVLVDLTGARVGPLDDDGRVRSWTCLDVPAGEPVQLLGASDDDTVHAALTSTGHLVTTRLGASGCGTTVPIAEPGTAELGPLARSGRYVFVPDRASGVTSVVDTARTAVVARLALGEPGHRVELITEDGLVFYNDLDSHVTGVLTLADGTWSAGEPIEKYSPTTERATGLLAAGRADGAPRTGGPGTGADTTWTRLPPLDRARDAAGPPRTSSAPDGPQIRDVTVRPLPLVLDAPATFVADATTTAADTWSWTLTDPTGDLVARDDTPGTFTAVPGRGRGPTFTVTLVVTDPQGRTARFAEDLEAVPEPVPHIDTFAVDDATPTVDQVVWVTAVETGLGDAPDATWEWTIGYQGLLGTFDPPPAPGAAIPLVGAEPGVYDLRLTITHADHQASEHVEITVGDRCTPTLDAQRTLDLRATGQGTLRVALADCFTARTVGVVTPPWLAAPGSVDVPGRAPVASVDGVPVNPPGSVVEVPVALVGSPPRDGTHAGALLLILDGREPVPVDVRVNAAPAWSGDPVCTRASADSDGRVRFDAGLTDADAGALDVRLTLTGDDGGTTTLRMTSDARGEGRFSALVAAERLVGVTAWGVSARDLHGASAPPPALGAPCW